MTNVCQFPLFCCDGVGFLYHFWRTVLGLFVHWVLLGVVNFLFKSFFLVPFIKLDWWREIAYLFLLWNDFLYWLWLIGFLGIVLWTGVFDLLAHVKHPPRPFWLSVFISKSGAILMGMLLYVTWFYSLVNFNILSLFCTFSFWFVCVVGYFLWSCLFKILYASCTPIKHLLL